MCGGGGGGSVNAPAKHLAESRWFFRRPEKTGEDASVLPWTCQRERK